MYFSMDKKGRSADAAVLHSIADSPLQGGTTHGRLPRDRPSAAPNPNLSCEKPRFRSTDFIGGPRFPVSQLRGPLFISASWSPPDRRRKLARPTGRRRE